MSNSFHEEIGTALAFECGKPAAQATVTELYNAISKAAMVRLQNTWQTGKTTGKRACYFSAEFLLGRMVHANLFNLGLLDEAKAYLRENGADPELFDQVEDAALGNGGLGRLAACFLDSAATQGIPLDGFGIRYRYGLFRQSFQNGFQQESAEDWQRMGDPWSIRREDERVLVSYRDGQVWAVPYDSPVIGYGGTTINTLRLWQAEPLCAFDFARFNQMDYSGAVEARQQAETLTSVVYPNEDGPAGKRLRLRQQYFFSAASLRCIVDRYKAVHGSNFSNFPAHVAIQLNDTHPVVSIPELLRILMEEELLSFEEALSVAKAVFAYTNHTIMPEALEKWDVDLFLDLIPQVYPYVVMLQNALLRELKDKGVCGTDAVRYAIIHNGQIHMARIAIYASHSTNGVAELHSRILKETALNEWYRLYPERFNNKTNGITQRRWLALCNPELSALITEKLGSNGWITNLDDLEGLRQFAGDDAVLDRFTEIKQAKKEQLVRYVQQKEGFTLNSGFLFDGQVKRLHEYKRQLLNAFSILDIYYGLKDGRIKDFTPTVFLFGAKAFPTYQRAKAIIKYCTEVARLVNNDPDMNGLLQVLFVSNYNVSYAEKLIPAVDVSEQISMAGTEASGTSNMKFMLNGAVTLGTYDGANVEIVEQAGEENNYIFGARTEDIARQGDSYDARALYEAEPRIRAVVDSLVNGLLNDGGTGMFAELYDALLKGASWHIPDHYRLLLDFIPYCEAKLQTNRDYRDRRAFSRKCLLNTAAAGKFSSDRTILQYAKEIWDVPSIQNAK